MISISCLESKLLNNNNWYGRFQLAPFQKGEGLTIANALRRTLLAEKSNSFITWVDFYNAEIPYSVLTGMRESIFDILLNLKQVIFTSDKILPNNSHLFKKPSNNNFRTQKVVFSKNKFNLEPKIHFSGSASGFTPSEAMGWDPKKFEHGFHITANNTIHRANQKNQDLIIDKNIHPKISKDLTNFLFSVNRQKKGLGLLPWGINKTLKLQNFKNKKIDPKTQKVLCQNQILGKTMNSKNETSSLVPLGIFPKNTNTNPTSQFLDIYNSKEVGNSTYLGYICVKGPATIYAKNIKLPKGLKCVDPNKYIVTLADDGLFYLRFALTTEIKTLPLNYSTNSYISIHKSMKFNTVRLKIFPKTLLNKELELFSSYRVYPIMKNLQKRVDGGDINTPIIGRSHLFVPTSSPATALKKSNQQHLNSDQICFFNNHYKPKYNNFKNLLISTKPVHLKLNLALFVFPWGKQTTRRCFGYSKTGMPLFVSKNERNNASLFWNIQNREAKQKYLLFFFKLNSIIGGEKKKHFGSSYLKSEHFKMRPINYTKNIINEQRLLLTHDSMKQSNFQNTSIMANIQKTCLLNIEIKHYYYKCGRFDRFLFDLIQPFKPGLKSVNANKPFLKNSYYLALQENIFFQDSDWKILTRFQKTLSHQKYTSQCLSNDKQNNFKPSVLKDLLKRKYLIKQLANQFSLQSNINSFFRIQYQGSQWRKYKYPRHLPRPSFFTHFQSRDCFDRNLKDFKNYFSKNQYFGSLVKWQKTFKSIKTSSIYDYLHKLYISDYTQPTLKNRISLVRSKLILNISSLIASNLNNEGCNLWISELQEPYIEKYLNLCFSFQCFKNNILYFLKFYILQYNNSLNKDFFRVKNTLSYSPFQRGFIYTEKLITRIKNLRKWLFLLTEQNPYHLAADEEKILLSKTKTYLSPLVNKLFLVGRVNRLEFLCFNQSKTLKYDHHLREFFDSTKRWHLAKKIGFLPTVAILKRLTNFINGYMLTYSFISQKRINQPSRWSGSAYRSLGISKTSIGSTFFKGCKQEDKMSGQIRWNLNNYQSFLKKPPFNHFKGEINKSFSISTNIRIKPFSSIQQVSYKPIWIFPCQFKENGDNLSRWLKNLNLWSFGQTQTRKNFFWNPSCLRKDTIKTPLKTRSGNSVVLKPIYLNVEQIIYILKQTTKFRKNQRINPIFLNALNNNNCYNLNHSLVFPKQFYSFHNFLYDAGLFNNIIQTKNLYFRNQKAPIPKKNHTYKSILPCHIWVLGNNFVFKNNSSNTTLKKEDANLNLISLIPFFNSKILDFVNKQMSLKRHLIIDHRYFSLLDVNYKLKVKNLHNEPYNINVYHSKISFNLRYNYPFKYTIFETRLPFVNFSKNVWDLPGKKNDQTINNYRKNSEILNSKIISSHHFDSIQYNESFKIYTTLAYACLKTYEQQLPKYHNFNRRNQKKSQTSSVVSPQYPLFQKTQDVAEPWSGTQNLSSPSFESLIEAYRPVQNSSNKRNWLFNTKSEKFHDKKSSVYPFLNFSDPLPSIFNHSSKWRIMNDSNFNDAFIVIPSNWFLNSQVYVLPNLTSLLYSFLPEHDHICLYLYNKETCDFFEGKTEIITNKLHWLKRFQNGSKNSDENGSYNSKKFFLVSKFKIKKSLKKLAMSFENIYYRNFLWNSRKITLRILNNAVLPLVTNRKYSIYDFICKKNLQTSEFLNMHIATKERKLNGTFFSSKLSIFFACSPKRHTHSCFKSPSFKPPFQLAFHKRPLDIRVEEAIWNAARFSNTENRDAFFLRNIKKNAAVFSIDKTRGLERGTKINKGGTNKFIGLPLNKLKRDPLNTNVWNYQNVNNLFSQAPPVVSKGYKQFQYPLEQRTQDVAKRWGETQNKITNDWVYQLSFSSQFSKIFNFQKPPFYSVRHKILGTTNFMCSETYPIFKNQNEMQNQKTFKPDFSIRIPGMSNFENQLYNTDISLIHDNKMKILDSKAYNEQTQTLNNSKQKNEEYLPSSTNKWQIQEQELNGRFFESFSSWRSKWKPFFQLSGLKNKTEDASVFFHSPSASFASPLRPQNKKRVRVLSVENTNPHTDTGSLKPFKEINSLSRSAFIESATQKTLPENRKNNLLTHNQRIGSQIFIEDPYTPEKLVSLRKDNWTDKIIQGSTSSSSKDTSKNDSKIKSPLISNLWLSSFFCRYSFYAISTKSDLFLQNLISFSDLADQNVDGSVFSQAPFFVPLEAQIKGGTQQKNIENNDTSTPVAKQINISQTDSKDYKKNLEEPFFFFDHYTSGMAFKKTESNFEQSDTNNFLKGVTSGIKTFPKSSYKKTVRKILKSQHDKSINYFIPNYDFHWQKRLYFAILREFKKPKLNNQKGSLPREKIGFNGYKNQYNDDSDKINNDASQNLKNALKNKHSIRSLKDYERYFGNPLRRRINQKGLGFYKIRLLRKLPKNFTTLKKTNQQIIKSWKSIIFTSYIDISFVFSYPLFIQNCNLPWQKSKYTFFSPKDSLHRLTVDLKPASKLTRFNILSKCQDLNTELNTNLFMTYQQLSSSSNQTHQPLIHNRTFKNIILPVHIHIENKGSYKMISYFTIKESLNSTYKVNYIVESQASESKSMSELTFHSNQENRVIGFPSSIESFHNLKMFENIQSDSVTTDSLTVSNFLNGTYSFVPNKNIILNSFDELIHPKTNKSKIENDNEYIQIDIWTNGEVSPRQALLNAFRKLFELFYNLSKYNSLKPIEI